MPPRATLTAQELLELRLPNKRTELVRGHLRVSEPAGYAHGIVSAAVAAAIRAYVQPRGLGHTLGAETGFRIFSNPDTVRAPDAAFLTRERAPSADTAGFPSLAPDLVVEVRSPGDTTRAVSEKVADWLAAGTRLVWVIDPARRTAHVHRQDGTDAVVAAREALDGEDVIRGFLCPLAEIFEL